MFFTISKILSFLTSPITWVAALLFISFFIKKRRKSRRVLLLSIVVFMFFSNSFIAHEFMRKWEVKAVSDTELRTNYDVGIVLGGGMITVDNKTDKLTFRNSVDRILQAVDLYKSKKIKKILISGGPGILLYKDMKESILLKKYLLKIGLPEKDIFIDSLSINTKENAKYSAAILREFFPGGKYLLITSGYHMKRSKACFEKEGVVTTCYSTDIQSGKRRYQVDHLLLPDLQSFAIWNRLIHEYVGYVIYKIMGYV